MEVSGLAGMTGTIQSWFNTSTHSGLNAQSATSPIQHKEIAQNFENNHMVLTICGITGFTQTQKVSLNISIH